MYNPPRGVFQHRQTVPANMSQQQNHVMGTSPANHMYQPVQTTMFVPNAAQAAPYTIGGSQQIITMRGTQLHPQAGYNPQYVPQQYTINTTQPAQYSVSSAGFNPVQPNNMNNYMYYQPIQASQGSTMPQQATPQQTPQQPSVQQQTQQPAMQTQQRPASQPASQPTLYQKRERKGLAIIDPSTGKDISVEIAPNVQHKTATPPQSTVTEVPAPQPQQEATQSTNIAAQFAAQVAATLTPASVPKPDVVLSHQQPAVPPVTSGQHPPQGHLQGNLSQHPPVHQTQAVTSNMTSQPPAGHQPPVMPIATNQPPPVRHPQNVAQVPKPQQPPTGHQPTVIQATSHQQMPGHHQMSGQQLPVQMQQRPVTTTATAYVSQQQQNAAVNVQPVPASGDAGMKQPAVSARASSLPVDDARLLHKHISSPEVPVAASSVVAAPSTPIDPQMAPASVNTHTSTSVVVARSDSPAAVTAVVTTSTVTSTAVINPQPIPTPVITETVIESSQQKSTQLQKPVVPDVPVSDSQADNPSIPCEQKAPEVAEVVQETPAEIPDPVVESKTDVNEMVKQDDKVEKEEVKDVEKTSENVEKPVVREPSEPKEIPKPVEDNVTRDTTPPNVVETPVEPESAVESFTKVEPTADATREKTPEIEVLPAVTSVQSKGQGDQVPEAVDIKVTDEDETNQIEANSVEVEDAEKSAEELDDSDEKSLDLKYEYKEDQWSPINLEGKKTYDRQFLLKMQFDQQSVTKPAGLPDLPELILDTVRAPPRGPGDHQFLRADMGNMDFTPGYVRGVGNQRGGMQQMRKSSSREQQRGNRSEPRKVISINREPEVVLQKAENPYKPSYKQQKETTDETKIEELYRKIRSILNKLTPQKFQTLMQQILDLDIDTEEKLKGAIDIIFEKAIDEPAFSVAYANACKIMATQVTVTSSRNPQEKVTFKKLLLNRCQTEFEKDKSEALDLAKMQKEIDEADSKDKKKLLQEEKDLAEAKAKRRSLGNIRFIGELFKLNMLTERIMHDCIMNLLKSTDEENLECLCRLVTTVGKLLDHDKAKPLMDQYFNKIEKIIKNKATSARTRFMLQDLQDLRSCKWKPRRDDNAPKTIEQIHKEAAEEKVEKQALHARLAQQPPPTPHGGRSGGGAGRSADEHGWQAVGPVRPNRIDPSKMKISKPSMDENITLGPGRAFGGWGRGSTGGGRNTSQEKERPSTPGNRFSALSGGSSAPQGTGGETDPRRSGHMSRGGSRDSRGRLTPRNSRNFARGSQEKERDAAIQAVRNLNPGRGDGRLTPSGSRDPSRDSSRDNRDREAAKPPPPQAPKEMSKETVDRKTKSIIDEYLSIHDLKEATECTKEIPANLMHCFADVAIQHVLERSEVARRMTGTLLHDLVKNKNLSVEQYLQGLKETLEFAEDMEIDIPKIWQYLGQLIGPMVQDGSVPLMFLKSACEPLLSCNKAGLVVSEVLKDATRRLGHVKTGEQWKSSGLQWSDFMKEEQVEEFIKQHQLEYTLDNAPLSPVGKGLSDDKIQVELNYLIAEKRMENELIFDWVDTNVGESNTKKPSFIRALMTAVCSSAIKGSMDKSTVDIGCIKMRGALLQRYMDHDALLELQALFALQALVHKLQHPPDVLRILFDTLYDEDIISEDAFNQWESSEDPKEQAGKGVARSSVVQFYRWLREAVEEEQ